MNADSRPSTPLTAEDAARIARTLLEVAASVELQERKVKEALRRAAAEGNLPLVQELIELWLGPRDSQAERLIDQHLP